MAKVPGAAFMDAEVVDLYRYRPPYAQQIHAALRAHAPSTGGLLDLGCGEGKIARPMSQVFDRVVAVDPSAKMIAFGKTLEQGRAATLEWIEARAEEAPLEGVFDVVTFASSIHWMDPGRLFAMLRRHVTPDHVLAFIAGDTPHEPPWQGPYRQFLAKWVPEITGQPLDSEPWQASRTRHLDHVDVILSETFLSEPFRQSVDDFILCQHSRDTFAFSKLGARRAAFHAELEALLRPHADVSGQLSYQVRTSLTLATLKGA